MTKKWTILYRVADQDPYQSEKLDPDPHYNQNAKALEAHDRAMDAHNGDPEAQNGALEGLYRSAIADSHHFEEELDPDTH